MLLINVSPSWCFNVSFQCKIVSLDKLCAQIRHRIVFYIFLVDYEYMCVVVSITPPSNGKCHCCLQK